MREVRSTNYLREFHEYIRRFTDVRSKTFYISPKLKGGEIII